MSTNLETFYGFSVALTDDLDAVRLAVLRERAERVVASYSYDPDQFHVYFHLLTITRSKSSHFGVKGLGGRLESLGLRFDVNPKQVLAEDSFLQRARR
jgi:hypothetical protein